MELVERMLENKISSSDMLCNPDHTITRKNSDCVSHDVEWKCGPHIFQRNLSNKTTDEADAIMVKIARFSSNVVRSIIVDQFAISESCMQFVATHCKNIRKLSLDQNMVQIYDTIIDLKMIFENNQHLDYVLLTQYYCDVTSLHYLPAESLRTLILYRCVYLPDSEFSEVSS